MSGNGNTSDGAASGEHWLAKYRRRLGIGESLVELSGYRCEPPKRGEITINFSASMPEPGDDGFGRISAIARNSFGDLVAVSNGTMKIGAGNKLGLELYALRAAGNLAKKLKEDGKHDGPVVFETSMAPVITCFLRNSVGDQELILEAFMPDDLEAVDEACRTVDGDGLRALPHNFLQMVEQDTINADPEAWTEEVEPSAEDQAYFQELSDQA